MSQTPAPTTEATSESEKLAGLVKPLEWVDLSDSCIAHTPFGVYKVAQAGETVNMFIARSELPKSFHATADEAKAAAQADYAARILSALDLSLITQQAAEIAGLRADNLELVQARLSIDNWKSIQRATQARRLEAEARAEVSESREAALLEKVRVMGEAMEQIEAEMKAGLGSSYGETREQVRRALAKMRSGANDGRA